MAFFRALEKAAEEWEIKALLETPIDSQDFPQKSEFELPRPQGVLHPREAPQASFKSSKPPKWTAADDQLLKTIVPKLKPDWKAIADHFPGRPKSMVRRRWENRFDPDIKKTPWSQEEDIMIVTLLEKIGPVWKEIAARMEGRPPDVIKNRFYGHIKRLKYLPSKSPVPAPSPDHPTSDLEDDWERLINLPEDPNVQPALEQAKPATIEELRREIERLETQYKLARHKLREMEEQQGE